MQSLLVDVNRIRNLATKNAFVAHETCRRTWKGLTLMCSEDDLQEDGFSERFKFDSTPPRNVVLRRTPSLEDSEYSSSAAAVYARFIDDSRNNSCSQRRMFRIFNGGCVTPACILWRPGVKLEALCEAIFAKIFFRA